MNSTIEDNNADNMNRLIWGGFFTSSIQYIICAPIVSMYMFLISRIINVSLGLIMIYVVLPILSVLSAYWLLHLVNRSGFRSGTQNKVSKSAVYRLSARLMSTLGFLLIGLIMGMKGVIFASIPSFIIFGEAVGIIEPHLLTNIFFYISVAIFPIAYSIFEYRLNP